jgi:hypothetical protein
MRTLLVGCLVLCGCASTAESDCRAGDWYALGERDATMGQRPQIERYAAQCARYQVQPAERDYMAGWSIGYSKTSFRQPN